MVLPTGIDHASVDAPEHYDAIRAMLPQLFIVFLKRLGGSIDVPVAEVDDTGQDLFVFSVDPVKRTFHFEIKKKS